MGLEYDDRRPWTFETLKFGTPHSTALTLVWEVHGDPVSDNYTPSEIDAGELMARWSERYLPDHAGEKAFGAGAVRIYWFVRGGNTFEPAPFQVSRELAVEDFLTTYTWPVDAATGERVSWTRLPVADKLWRSERADKGGFFQEATGWKPSPLQPAVYLPQLLAAAGIASR